MLVKQHIISRETFSWIFQIIISKNDVFTPFMFLKSLSIH